MVADSSHFPVLAIPPGTAGQLLTAVGDGTATWSTGGGLGSWQDYAVTLYQGGAVPISITSARYVRIGNTVSIAVYVTVTGAGAVADNGIQVSLPFAPAHYGPVVGAGFLYDASGMTAYSGSSYLESEAPGGLDIFPATGSNGYQLGNVGSGFGDALDVSDQIRVSATYEAV